MFISGWKSLRPIFNGKNNHSMLTFIILENGKHFGSPEEQFCDGSVFSAHDFWNNALVLTSLNKAHPDKGGGMCGYAQRCAEGSGPCVKLGARSAPAGRAAAPA